MGWLYPVLLLLTLAPAALGQPSTPREAARDLPPGPQPSPAARELPPTRLQQVGPSMRGPALLLSEEVRAFLREERWQEAHRALAAQEVDDLPAHDRGDWAFVAAWTAIRAGEAGTALGLLPMLDRSEDAPPAYRALVRAEVLRGAEQRIEALTELEAIPTGSAARARAQLIRGELLRELGRTQEGFAAFAALAERREGAGARGRPIALLALAHREGQGSPEARPYLHDLWVHHPRSPEAEQARQMLAADPGWEPTWRDASERAWRQMQAGAYSGAIETLRPHEGQLMAVEEADADACRARYTLGRSRTRRRDASGAVRVLTDLGSWCREADREAGAKGQYLYALSLQRLGRTGAARAAFEALGQAYPDHRYGDDGYTEAAQLARAAGDVEEADALLLRAIREHPRGDTGPDAVMHRAFERYLEGDAAGAVELARELAALPLDGEGWVDVQAGRYWAARWTLYPDVERPTEAVEDASARRGAIEGWRALCMEAPIGFYSILAHARLQELAPELATELAARAPDWRPELADRAWQVRPEILSLPVQEAVALARLGLVQEAAAVWAAEVDEWKLRPDEMAWWIEARAGGGDWLAAHDRLRKWLRRTPPSALGPEGEAVLRVAYPDRYWEEAQAAAAPYAHLEPRLLHALVREESNFNASIRSHAGARGLAQLMPGTARETAGRLRRSIPLSELDDPRTNLDLGAKYLEVVLRMFRNNPVLALAGYNAGPGRVKQWLGAWGNVPTDEFVERIPYQETRAYVKRVMGTWQIMRYSFDPGPAWADLSPYNQRARLEEAP